MGLLKSVVIGTAILIVVGIGVLIWGVTHHWNDSSTKTASPAAAPASSATVPATVAPAAPGAAPESIAAEIAVPEGTHLEQMSTTADRLILRFAGPQGDRIMVVDPKSGRVTGTISVVPASK